MRLVRTSGDRQTRNPLSDIGGEGIFVKELQSALLARRIDTAVHSLKDVPTSTPDGLTLAAISRREDPRDALISRGRLRDLPQGARVGTGSPRRACQLRAVRSDLEVVAIRGNLGTRIRKVEAGEVDAVVVAAAALVRMGWLDRATEILPIDVMLPAVGQGALAVEIRADDEAMREIALSIDDRDTHLATTAERAFLRHLGGGCRVPIAALGSIESGKLRLQGLVADEQGQRVLRGDVQGPADDAEALGVRLAERLLAEGASELLEEIS